MLVLRNQHNIAECCCMQVILGRGILIHVAALLDKTFRGHPNALLYFVMVMCPLCMNLVQVSHACHKLVQYVCMASVILVCTLWVLHKV